MVEPSPRNRMNGIFAVIALAVECLIDLAAGPKLRVAYAISRAARRARVRSRKW